jgi:hypothetical protein
MKPIHEEVIGSVPESGKTLTPTMANAQKQAQTSTQQHVPADVGAIVRERDALYKELQSAKAVVEVMEDTLDYRQKELERQEGKRKKAEQQSQVYKTDMEKYKAEVAQLKQNTEKRTAQLQKKLAERQQGEQTALKQLEDARNHIFRLQPRRTDITEIEANELFNDLFNNIQRWAANRLEKILDMQEDGRLRGRTFPREAARKVLQLTSARGMQSNKWDGSDEFQIIAIIMRFLCRSFFDRVFYCPLTAEGQQNINDTTTIISRVEQLMKALPRGNIYLLLQRAQQLIPGRWISVPTLACGSSIGVDPGTWFYGATRSLRGLDNNGALQLPRASCTRGRTARSQRLYQEEHDQASHGASSPFAIGRNHFHVAMDIFRRKFELRSGQFLHDRFLSLRVNESQSQW